MSRILVIAALFAAANRPEDQQAELQARLEEERAGLTALKSGKKDLLEVVDQLERSAREQTQRAAALEREVAAVRARRVLDAGSGEGGVAMALAARYADMEVEGVEVAATNVKIARRLNRFRNARFRQGLAEEVHQAFPPGSFDLVYSFAVLEHVRDVEETIRSIILRVLRPSTMRICFSRNLSPIRQRSRRYCSSWAEM